MKPIILCLLYAVSVFAQQTAGIVVNPRFQALDTNGAPLPLSKLCSYAAGTLTPQALYADAGGVTPLPNPVIMNGAGQATIYGEGNYKFILLQPGTTSDCTTGATVWTIDNIYILTASPTFNSVVATTFNSTASGGTAAFQQQFGTFEITGAGNASFQTVVATSVFNSLATGSTSAFQTGSGTMKITGDGNGAFQSVAANYLSLVGQSSDVTAPGSGFAFIEYNTTLGQIRFNLGGAGWTGIPSVPGSNTDVIFNSSGVLGASSHFTFASDVLTLGGSATTGVVAPLFNSTNTGTNNAFQNSSGDFFVTGAGNLGAQSVTANNVAHTTGFLTGTSSNTDTAGSINMSGGTFTMSFPSGHTYSTPPFCFASESDTVPHAVGLVSTTTGLSFFGTGSDTVAYHCIGAVF
jgi:hypothetical protein